MKIHHNTVKKAAKFKIVMSAEDNEVIATSKDGTRLASGLQGNKVLEDAIVKLTGHVAKKSTQRPVSQPKGTRKAAKAKKAKVSPKEKACRDAGYVKVKGGFKQEGDDEIAHDCATWDELYVALVEADEIEAISGHGFKQKYKDKYAPTHGRCGDDLGEKITAHCEVQGEDGRPQTGRTELQRFAEANGAWKAEYASLTNKFGTWNAGSVRASVANILRGKIRRATKDGETFKIKWV
jgi:hypothetical protein